MPFSFFASFLEGKGVGAGGGLIKERIGSSKQTTVNATQRPSGSCNVNLPTKSLVKVEFLVYPRITLEYVAFNLPELAMNLFSDFFDHTDFSR